MTAFDSRYVGHSLKNFWNLDFTAEGCGDAERFASVAFGVFKRALRDLDARTCCQRCRQIDAGSFKDGLVGQPTGFGQITTLQGGLGRPDLDYPGSHGLSELPRGFTRLPRRGGIAGGQAGDSDHPAAVNVEVLEIFGRAVQRLVRRRSRAEQVTLQSHRVALAHQGEHLQQRVVSCCRLVDDLAEQRDRAGQITAARPCISEPNAGRT